MSLSRVRTTRALVMVADTRIWKTKTEQYHWIILSDIWPLRLRKLVINQIKKYSTLWRRIFQFLSLSLSWILIEAFRLWDNYFNNNHQHPKRLIFFHFLFSFWNGYKGFATLLKIPTCIKLQTWKFNKSWGWLVLLTRTLRAPALKWWGEPGLFSLDT